MKGTKRESPVAGQSAGTMPTNTRFISPVASSKSPGSAKMGGRAKRSSAKGSSKVK